MTLYRVHKHLSSTLVTTNITTVTASLQQHTSVALGTTASMGVLEASHSIHHGQVAYNFMGSRVQYATLLVYTGRFDFRMQGPCNKRKWTWLFCYPSYKQVLHQREHLSATRVPQRWPPHQEHFPKLKEKKVQMQLPVKALVPLVGAILQPTLAFRGRGNHSPVSSTVATHSCRTSLRILLA